MSVLGELRNTQGLFCTCITFSSGGGIRAGSHAGRAKNTLKDMS